MAFVPMSFSEMVITLEQVGDTGAAISEMTSRSHRSYSWRNPQTDPSLADFVRARGVDADLVPGDWNTAAVCRRMPTPSLLDTKFPLMTTCTRPLSGLRPTIDVAWVITWAFWASVSTGKRSKPGSSCFSVEIASA